MIVHDIPYRLLLPIDKTSATPVYRQIAEGLIAVIIKGLLQPGDKLPPSRQLAELLQVHRKTILAAYDELASEEWIDTVAKKGFYVLQKLPDIKPHAFEAHTPTEPYKNSSSDFFMNVTQPYTTGEKKNQFQVVVNDGFPDARIAPVDSLLKHYRTLLKKSYSQGMFMLGDAAGAYSLRIEIATFIDKTRLMKIGAENVLITRGAQMAIFIAASMILKPGATVIVGTPGYFMANNIFEHFGAKLVHVPVDEHGIDIQAIEQICQNKRPDMIYIIPHHHHPTTVTLSADRRISLLNLIKEYRIPTIEDDYDYDFHYKKTPILPLASANHAGHILYIGSVTKSFASSVRIGYLVAGAEFIAQASGIREMIDIRGDILMEDALAMLYKNGEMQQHLNKAVKLYRTRRDYLCDQMETELGDMVSFARPHGGMAVWVRFAEQYQLAKIAVQVAKQGIFMSDGIFYNTSGVNHNALRIGFAAMNQQEMDLVVDAIKRAK